MNISKYKLNPKSAYERIEVPKDFFCFTHPSRILVAGPTQSGKSHWILSLLREREKQYPVKFDRVIFCTPYTHLKEDYCNELKKIVPDIEFLGELPDIESDSLGTSGIKTLLICDDLMDEFFESKQMNSVLTALSHHGSISLIVTVQNLHIQRKDSVTKRSQFSYIVAFVGKGNKTSIKTLSTQFFPGRKNILSNIASWISSNLSEDKSKYLVIDVNPRSEVPEALSIRTRIFLKENKDIRPIYFVLNSEI